MIDEEWLLKRKSDASSDEIYAFSERVGIKLDGNTNHNAVDIARNESLKNRSEF